MIKSAVILFLTLLIAYLPFSRVPDYFDSETTPALIEKRGDKVVAVFKELGKTYVLSLPTEKYNNKIGERVSIRYELNQPEHATIDQVWNYWIVPNELAFAMGSFIILLGVAYATTHRPDPSALAEQLEYKKEDNGKYQ